jgi:hypothetical protein
MTVLEKIEKQYNTGYPIFCKFFELKHEDLRKKLGEMFSDKRILDIISDGSVKKVTSDDEPEQISIHFYDEIQINFLGISLTPEHNSKRMLIEFTEHFSF